MSLSFKTSNWIWYFCLSDWISESIMLRLGHGHWHQTGGSHHMIAKSVLIVCFVKFSNTRVNNWTSITLQIWRNKPRAKAWWRAMWKDIQRIQTLRLTSSGEMSSILKHLDNGHLSLLMIQLAFVVKNHFDSISPLADNCRRLVDKSLQRDFMMQ